MMPDGQYDQCSVSMATLLLRSKCGRVGFLANSKYKEQHFSCLGSIVNLFTIQYNVFAFICCSVPMATLWLTLQTHVPCCQLLFMSSCNCTFTSMFI